MGRDGKEAHIIFIMYFLQESKDYRIRALEKLKDEWVFFFHWLL